MRQRTNKVMRICHLGGCDDFVVRDVITSVSDVFADGSVEQDGLLTDHADYVSQPRQIN